MDVYVRQNFPMNKYTIYKLEEAGKYFAAMENKLRRLPVLVDRGLECLLCNTRPRHKVRIEGSHQLAKDNVHQGKSLKFC
jgi:hypothetical protein